MDFSGVDEDGDDVDNGCCCGGRGARAGNVDGNRLAGPIKNDPIVLFANASTLILGF